MYYEPNPNTKKVTNIVSVVLSVIAIVLALIKLAR